MGALKKPSRSVIKPNGLGIRRIARPFSHVQKPIDLRSFNRAIKLGSQIRHRFDRCRRRQNHLAP